MGRIINIIMIELNNKDCIEALKNFKSNSVDLIVSDINYGTLNKQNPDAQVSNVTFDTKTLKEYCRLLKKIIKPTGTIIFFGKELFTVDIINILRPIYKYRYVWKKGNNVTNFLNASRVPLCNHEDIMIFQKDDTRKNSIKKPHTYNPQKHEGEKRYASIKNIGKQKSSSTYGAHKEVMTDDTNLHYPTTILNYVLTKEEQLIPTQKPVDLMLYLVETYTNAGELVLDPCMGVGSTGIACKMCGRDFIGYEIDEERFQIAQKRINNIPEIRRLNF